MPDLIIKPTATSGNKLILQDQAGGAVLTTADSGATYANATLTTPTIANMANCTFPVGHILQTTLTTYHSGNSDGETGSTMIRVVASSNYHWKGSISGLQTNSDVLIFASFTGSIFDNDTSTAHGSFGFLRDDDGSGTNLTIIRDGSNNEWYNNKAGHTGTNDHYMQFTLSFIDTSPTQTAHTYYLGYRTASGSTIRVNSDSSNAPFQMILQEIKR